MSRFIDIQGNDELPEHDAACSIAGCLPSCPRRHADRVKSLNEARQAEVRRIVKECTDQLDALNYGMLSLIINDMTEKYLATHYPA